MSDVKLSVIYYSATSSVYTLAQQAVEAGEKAGAEVRLRKVKELAPAEAIASNEGWSAHAKQTESVQEATADDVVWADAVMFGTPTRYGNVAAQLKLFGLEDALGEAGWLKALRLEGYAVRSRRRPDALQQALFPYHEAWG